MIATIVGKRDQTYTQKTTGELRNAREIYIVKEPPSTPRAGFEGCEVDRVWCGSLDISKIPVGSKCKFEYEKRNGRNGEYAALVDILVLEK